jgi:hemerythrin-like metal-binding protein
MLEDAMSNDTRTEPRHLGFFEVGYAPIDRQHVEFCQLMQALIDTDDFDYAPRLLDIHTHLLRHCAEEEQWMRDSGFPSYDDHKSEHESLLEVVSEVRRRCDTGDVEIVQHLATALPQWFETHANTMDAALSFHLQQVHGLRESDREAVAA